MASTVTRCLKGWRVNVNSLQQRLRQAPRRFQRTCCTRSGGVDYAVIQELCRTLALTIVEPVAAQVDSSGKYPSEQIAKLGEHGLMGMTASAEYGGAGLDMTSVSIAVEELSRCCASTGSIVSIHNALYVDLLATRGTDQQKELFLKPYTSCKPGSFALSEPDAGSDVANMSTIAVKHGDCYVLNGNKSWVTSAKQADNAIIFATVDRTLKHRGITAFIVPLKAEGVLLSKEDVKLGIRGTSTCQISLCEVMVPCENVIGKIGGGFKIAMEQLNKARIGIASQALGISQAALDTSLKYASERRAFGKHLKDIQAVKLRLARMAAQIESSRLLVRKAAALCDSGKPFLKNSAIAKLMASETANFAANQCIQILGGMGFTNAMPAERYFRDARVTEIYGGVSDIQMMIIAEQILSDFAQN